VLLQDRLQMSMKRSRRDGSMVGVLMIDLDHFKRINDSLGHHVGDMILSKISERLGNCVRAGDTVARMGGDEFVILVEDGEARAVRALLARIKVAMAEPILLESDERVVVSLTAGAASADGNADVDALLGRADAAMYAAKGASDGPVRGV
jgi:diguanylate cyclase (GGDEF)-like protein